MMESQAVVKVRRWAAYDENGVSIWDVEPAFVKDDPDDPDNEDGDGCFEHDSQNPIMEELDNDEFRQAFGFCPEFKKCRSYTYTETSSVTTEHQQ